MITEQHRQTLIELYHTQSTAVMLDAIQSCLSIHHPNGPLGDGSCTIEEVVHCYLSIAGVPVDGLSIKQRLAYYQIMTTQ